MMNFTPESILIYTFLIIIFLSFVIFTFSLKEKKDDFRKIIGGLSILTVASLSKNGWVIFTSLFIGGLIVASEEFMTNLAAILRTQGDKMSDTLGKIRSQKATTKEIQQKSRKEERDIRKSIEEEIKLEAEKDIQIENSNIPKRSFGLNEKVNERIQKLKDIEEKLRPMLLEKFGDRYRPQMKIKGTNSRELVVDGLICNGEIIDKIIEIKYVNKNSIENSLIYVLQRFREKLIKLGIEKPKVLFIIISEDLNESDVSNIQKLNKFSQFLYFNITEDSNLQEVKYSK